MIITVHCQRSLLGFWVECTNDDYANPWLTLEFNCRCSLNHGKHWCKCWIYLGLTQLIKDFINFLINICSGLDVNENVNSRINLIFVGAF